MSLTHFSGQITSGLCPCCNDGFTKIKSELINISTLVKNPIPKDASAQITPLIDSVRAAGLSMLTQLNLAFVDLKMQSCLVEFEQSVRQFDTGVDEFMRSSNARHITERGVFHLYALRFAFGRLGKSVRELVDELGIDHLNIPKQTVIDHQSRP